MNYILSTNHIHVSEVTRKMLERRMNSFYRYVPSHLKSQRLHISLKENIAKNYVQGTATYRLPGKTLIVKAQARNIKQVISELTVKLQLQVLTYKTTHDRRHSDYPKARTIRRGAMPMYGEI